MERRSVNLDDIRSYFVYSNDIKNLESTLYESGKDLTQEESKITNLVAAQNKIRFGEDEKDRFRDQVETVIRALALKYKRFGFDHNLYFDLVYNLLFLEYERVDKLTNEDGVKTMFHEIGIRKDLKEKVKSLLDHEEEMKNAVTEDEAIN